MARCRSHEMPLRVSTGSRTLATRNVPLAIASNLRPPGIDELMPKILATATVDRLIHHAHVVVTAGELPPKAASSWERCAASELKSCLLRWLPVRSFLAASRRFSCPRPDITCWPVTARRRERQDRFCQHTARTVQVASRWILTLARHRAHARSSRRLLAFLNSRRKIQSFRNARNDRPGVPLPFD